MSNGTHAFLSETFLLRHPLEAAQVAEQLPPEQVQALFRSVTPAHIAPLVARLDPSVANDLMTAGLEADHAAKVLESLPIDDAGVLARRLSAKRRAALFGLMSTDAAAVLEGCLAYAADSAGGLVDPRVMTFFPDISVEEALRLVPRAGKRAHYYVYVVDRFHVLLGVVSLRELFMAAPDALVGAIAKRDVARIGATASRAEILAHPGWDDFHALPVVDAGRRFVGMLRHETLRRLESGDTLRQPRTDALSLTLDVTLLWVKCSGTVVKGLASVAESLSTREARSK